MTRAVFLDRDNTIIHNDGDLGDPDQVKLIQGAASAIASLRGLGFQIVIVTNQGGVARGKYEEADVDRVHERVAEMIKQTSGAIVECFYYCPYHPEATVEKYKQDHPWRKPQPGMLLQAAEDLGLSLDACWMVGDQLRDIEAGWEAGTRSVLLQPEAKEPEGYEPPAGKRLLVASNLVDAVRLIAQHPQAERGEDLQQQNIIRAMKGASEQFGSDLPTASGSKGGGSVSGSEGGGVGGSVGNSAINAAGMSKLSPAIEKIHDGPNTSTVPKGAGKTARPFKPWEIQPVIVEPEVAEAPETAEAAKASKEEAAADESVVEKELPVAEVAETPLESPPEVPPEAPPEAPPEISQEISTEAPVEAAPVEAVEHVVEPRGKSRKKKKVRKKAPASAASDATAGDDPQVANLLHQILRELKSHRANYGDFSWLKMLAGLMQMLAIGCIAFSLYAMGDPAVFNQWALGAVFSQLVVITMLITDQNR